MAPSMFGPYRHEKKAVRRAPTKFGRVPNAPKTPMHSFRCPDDLWDAAKAKAEERGENWSEELRKMVERYVKRR